MGASIGWQLNDDVALIAELFIAEFFITVVGASGNVSFPPLIKFNDWLC